MGKRALTRSEALKDIKKVADYLGRTPTYREYAELGEYHSVTLKTACGTGWHGVVSAAGLVPITGATKDCGKPRNLVTDNEIFDDIVRVAKELGRQPTRSDYQQMGRYGLSTATRRFGESWVNAVKSAGLKYTSISERRRISQKELKADLIRLRELLGHNPDYPEYKKYGKYSNKPYLDFVGKQLRPRKWREVLMYFLKANKEDFYIPLTERSNKELVTMIAKLKAEIRTLETTINNKSI